MLNPDDFLTEAESIAVDQSLLSAKEKFSTRVAIYSLRVLQTMASGQGSSSSSGPPREMSDITPSEISEWLVNHQPMDTRAGLEPDPAFSQFFTQIVLSSIRPLNQIASETGKKMDALGPEDVIAWFEKEAKVRVEEGEGATFLGQRES